MTQVPKSDLKRTFVTAVVPEVTHNSETSKKIAKIWGENFNISTIALSPC